MILPFMCLLPDAPQDVYGRFLPDGLILVPVALCSKPEVHSRNHHQAAERIEALDVLRGFALLGIFWVNIVYFALPYSAYNLPLIIGDADYWNQLTWWLGNQFIEGSMFALFSMLFGASALILLDQKRLDDPGGVAVVDRYYRRNLWLILFGLVHSFLLLAPFDILFAYGVLGLALFPLRRVNPWWLLLVGLILTSIFVSVPGDEDSSDPEASVVLSQYRTELSNTLGKYPRAIREQRNSAFQKSQLADMTTDVALYKSGYADIFHENIESAVYQQSNNLLLDNFFDAGGMMLIGMALFKFGILSGARSAAFYWLMMLLGYTTALAMRFPLAYEAFDLGIPPTITVEQSAYRHFIARLPLAVGHIGLIMLLGRVTVLLPFMRMLAAVGRMALSNYLLQTLFSIVMFYGFGLALFAELERYQLGLLALFFGVVQMLFSVFFLSYFRHGPLEWLWRSLVHTRRLPMLRRSVLAGQPKTVP